MSNKPVASELAEVFQSFDAQDVGKLAEFMTEDVQLRLGNAPLISGKAAFVEAVNGFLGSQFQARVGVQTNVANVAKMNGRRATNVDSAARNRAFFGSQMDDIVMQVVLINPVEPGSKRR